MTLFVYDQDRSAFAESVHKALEAVCTSTFIREYRVNTSSQDSIKKLFDELGIIEFSRDEGCSLSDLALFSKEIGRALAPSAVIQQAFISGLANRQLDLKIADCLFGFGIKGSKAIHFIADDKAKAIIVVPEGGLLQAVPLSLHPSVAAMTLHDSLDLTDVSYCAEIQGGGTSLSEEQSSYLKLGYGVLLSAELCGILDRMLEVTTEYVKTRKQFGVPVGAFQAVAHQLAECALINESAWSLVECAAHTIDEFTAKSAILYCCENIPTALETTLQLHGGIGFTWEYDLHLFLRRARKISSLINVKPEQYQELLSLAV